MRSSESVAELSVALVKANLVLTNPAKDRTATVRMKQGGTYTYDYVDLASILDDVRPVLHTHGLAVVQEAAAADRGVAVTTRLIHTSGEWLEFDALVMPAAGDAQAVGSAITYARRYALCAALSIAADEDDDGKSSGAGAGGSQPAPGSKSSPAPVSTKDERGNQDGPMSVADEAGPQQGSVGSVVPAAASSHVHEWIPAPNERMARLGWESCSVAKCQETRNLKKKGA